METLFLIGSIPFWILTAATIVAILVAVENERGFFATLSLGIYLGLLHLLGDASLHLWVRDHWKLFAALAVAYLVLGTVWGVVKWAFFTRKLAHESEEVYLTIKRRFLRHKKIVLEDLSITDPVPEHLREEWKTFLAQDYEGSKLVVEPPQVSQHKARIMGWMTFWPVSLTWTLLNDPVRAAFQHIYASISSTLQDISNKAFNHLATTKKLDLEIPPKLQEAATPVSSAEPGTTLEAGESESLITKAVRQGGNYLGIGVDVLPLKSEKRSPQE